MLSVRPSIATRVYCDKTAEVRFIPVDICFCGHEIRLNCVCCDKTTDMLSVRLSIGTRVYCDKTAEVRFTPVHICFAVMKLD